MRGSLRFGAAFALTLPPPVTSADRRSAASPQLEADRRAINITVNSLDTDFDPKEREKLYPTIGQLFPEGTSRLAKATDIDAVRGAIDAYPVGRAPPTALRAAQSSVSPWQTRSQH